MRWPLKDVYVEKPVTHKLEGGEQLGRAVAASKQILQVGMQQRSWPHIAEAKALFLDTGALGQITFIETRWYQNHTKRRTSYPDLDASKLNWKAFLGSAPDQPINAIRYFDWRNYWDFGGGSLTDLFTHWIDVVHWFMESTLPTSAFTMGARYRFPDRECPDTLNATFLYPGNFQVIFHSSKVPNAPAAVGINAARPGQMRNLSFRENRLVLSSSLNLRNDAEQGVCA
jgi:predicted dehydrogenase